MSPLDCKKPDKADPRRQFIAKSGQAKASICSKVERVSRLVENLFRHRKCRYKGLAKNTTQSHVLFAMAIWGCRSEVSTRRTG